MLSRDKPSLGAQWVVLCQGPLFYDFLCQGFQEVMGHVTPPYIRSLRRGAIVHAWALYLSPTKVWNIFIFENNFQNHKTDGHRIVLLWYQIVTPLKYIHNFTIESTFFYVTKKISNIHVKKNISSLNKFNFKKINWKIVQMTKHNSEVHDKVNITQNVLTPQVSSLACY